MNTKTILMTIAGGAALVCSTGCEKENGRAGAPAMPPVPVGVMNMVQQDVTLYQTWFGHLRGVQEAAIRPEVSGKLLRQVYRDGSMCRQGDVLFEIDPASYKAAVDMAAANLEAAKASVLRAQAACEQVDQDVARYSKLVQSGTVSEKNYTDALQAQKEARAARCAAEAQVSQAEANLENAQINLDRCTIRAPFTGLASKSTASTGELLSASGQPLTTMSSIDPIRVDFAVPTKQPVERFAGNGYNPAEQGSPIKEFRLLLDGGAEFPHPGKVVAVDSEVSRSTGTIYFIGEIPNPNHTLRSGTAVRVRAVTGVEKDAFLVPTRALIASMNHRYIYIVAPDKTPVGVDVKPGGTLVLDMPDGKGGQAPMLMQVVYASAGSMAEKLREIGYENPADAPVVVEGSQMAEKYAQANRAMRMQGATAGFGTVAPAPFQYTVPVSTTPSVTAQGSQH